MSAEIHVIRGGTKVAAPGQPDEAVVETLQFLLDTAKAGRIAGIAYSLNFSDDSTNNFYVGVISRGQVGGLFAVMQRISAELDADA